VSDLLRIYMQDHLAGSTLGLDLARRAAASNSGSALGAALERVAAEIDEDRESLRRVMAAYGVGPDRLKNVGAWGFEKIGRLKPNGRVLGYSPLSKLIEVEGLLLGITGKLALWRTLEVTIGPEIAGENFAMLAERAEEQRRTLEPHRIEAAREAFAEASPGRQAAAG
jgi:hypothetical protein